MLEPKELNSPEDRRPLFNLHPAIMRADVAQRSYTLASPRARGGTSAICIPESLNARAWGTGVAEWDPRELN